MGAAGALSENAARDSLSKLSRSMSLRVDALRGEDAHSSASLSRNGLSQGNTRRLAGLLVIGEVRGGCVASELGDVELQQVQVGSMQGMLVEGFCGWSRVFMVGRGFVVGGNE